MNILVAIIPAVALALVTAGCSGNESESGSSLAAADKEKQAAASKAAAYRASVEAWEVASQAEYDATHPETSAIRDARQQLVDYATELARANGQKGLSLIKVGNPLRPENGDVMSTYLIYFVSSDEKYRLREVKQEGDLAYRENSHKADVWDGQFCTVALNRIMIRNRIDVVFGQVLTPNMADNDTNKMSTGCFPPSQSVRTPATEESLGSCTAKQRSVMRSFLIREGLTCDRVSHCSALSPQNIRVTCNENAFKYLVLDKGAGYYVEFD